VHITNIWHLGIKELRVLSADPILLLLIVYTLTVAVYTVAADVKMDVRNVAVAVVDEDGSALSRGIAQALLPPQFGPARLIAANAATEALDRGRFTFILGIPPRFEADLLARRPVEVAIEIDATAMAQAGNGSVDIQQIIRAEVGARIGAVAPPVDLVMRARFNPNGIPEWFSAIMAVINSITILSILLPGAALLREREHGTLEHLLALPVTPLEIALAKIGATTLAILGVAMISVVGVVHGLLGVPLAGSLTLFFAGALLFQVSLAALGIFLASFTRTTGQFGLLALPVIMLLMLLSGGMTPLESMPAWLQQGVQVSPAMQFVAFAPAVLYRGAGLGIVWPRLLVLLALGGAFLAAAMWSLQRALARGD
jgi:ABC-2 type transport system permease protein